MKWNERDPNVEINELQYCRALEVASQPARDVSHLRDCFGRGCNHRVISPAVAATSSGGVKGLSSYFLDHWVSRDAGDLRHTFVLNLASNEVTSVDSSGAVVVTGPNGVDKIIQPAWALDGAGEAVPSSFSVSGNQLTQTILPDRGSTFPIISVPVISAPSRVSSALAAKAKVVNAVRQDAAKDSAASASVTPQLSTPANGVCSDSRTGISYKSDTSGYVSVPSSYCYGLNSGHVSWHDYCTHSPDSFFSASFQGPCAYHDMCLQYRWKTSGGCNNELPAYMMRNCEYAYAFYNPMRYDCYSVAAGYWAAVWAWTAIN